MKHHYNQQESIIYQNFTIQSSLTTQQSSNYINFLSRANQSTSRQNHKENTTDNWQSLLNARPLQMQIKWTS